MTNGNHDESWKKCYRELAPRLLLFARQWAASAADAEDIVQTAFVKFWRRMPKAQPEHYALLYATVRTTALDLLRGNDRRVRRENDPDAEMVREESRYFDVAVEQRENAVLIETAMRHLPQEQREVLVLRIWSELTFAEIATALDESINTVASRYRYALEALRKLLKTEIHERV